MADGRKAWAGREDAQVAQGARAGLAGFWSAGRYPTIRKALGVNARDAPHHPRASSRIIARHDGAFQKLMMS